MTYDELSEELLKLGYRMRFTVQEHGKGTIGVEIYVSPILKDDEIKKLIPLLPDFLVRSTGREGFISFHHRTPVATQQ